MRKDEGVDDAFEDQAGRADRKRSAPEPVVVDDAELLGAATLAKLQSGAYDEDQGSGGEPPAA
jgi:hypothetical protein